MPSIFDHIAGHYLCIARSDHAAVGMAFTCGATHASKRHEKMTNSREADLLAAAGCGDVVLLEKLLPAAGDLTAFDGPDGMTPLMAAASAGHEAAVELLLERGSNPSRRDVQGRSAAEHARLAGHTHLAARLDGVVDQEHKIW